MSHTVYLALGGNVGDRAANLRLAIRRLSTQVEILIQSPIYETAPWGNTDQPDFLNQVLGGTTDLEPLDLLAFVKQVETKLGRQPIHERYGPRRIDVDILFYDDLVLESDELNIPHQALEERVFVLVPLADLAPDLRHPTLGRTVSELLAEVDTSGVWPAEES